jgi:nitrate/nitrite transporter NarK
MYQNKQRNRIGTKFFTIISNGAFLFPFYLLISQSRYVLAGIIGLIFVVSSAYHTTKPTGTDSPWLQKKRTPQHRLLLWSDVLLTLSFGVYVFFVHLVPNLPQENSLRHELVLIVFIIGLSLYAYPAHKYELRHSLWHILAATSLYLVFL